MATKRRKTYQTLNCARHVIVKEGVVYVIDTFGGCLSWTLRQSKSRCEVFMVRYKHITAVLFALIWGGSTCQPFQPSVLESQRLVNTATLAPVQLPPNAAGRYAFVDVNVVTMAKEEILSHRTVLVADKKIVAIGRMPDVDLPPGVSLIDGSGKYLLPGLADMHIHLRREYYLLLLLLNGVTTVRNMDGQPRHLQWREQIANGTLLGPTIFTTGPILDELPSHLPDSRPLATLEGALRIVAEQKQLGYDALKAYDGLSGSSYKNLMLAASVYNMPVVGHVPNGLRLIDVIEAGQRSVEHLDGYFNFYDDQMPAVIEALVAHDVWTVPTLTCFQLLAPSTKAPADLQAEMLAAIPNIAAQFHDLPADFAEKGYCYAPVNALQQRMIAQLAAAGAPILLGTDAPMPYTVPGFAVHQELHNLVDAGLTPYAALRTATYNAALFVHQADQVGTVAVGKRADLLLVDANPLEDVDNLRQITGVMVQGRWLPRWSIFQLLQQVEEEEP